VFGVERRKRWRNNQTPRTSDGFIRVLNCVWRGCAGEHNTPKEIICALALSAPDDRFYFWRTSDGYETDLLIERGGVAHTLCEIKIGSGADVSAARRLAKIANQLGVRENFILSQQNGNELLAPSGKRLGPEKFLAWWEYSDDTELVKVTRRTIMVNHVNHV
jgi:hypothetical protein